ncbi:MAG: M20/M25/M40 family metallo-hydrolase [Gemmatimonadetes bacterium]|nr:M20/M25/M40 family metallo-hydrolase [Gemmatimonadota bacterium]
MTVRVQKSALVGALALLAAPIPAFGQSSDSAQAAAGAEGVAATAGVAGIPGFRAGAVEDQREYERALRRAIDPDTVARFARGLSNRSHMAGTSGQRATRDSVMAWLTAAGLEVGYDSLVLYMPQPLEVSVARVFPTLVEFDLTEPPIPEDPSTRFDVVPAFHAYSGSGTVEAEVVFVNYGLPADYQVLESLGVSVEGRVVLARYGRSFRGIKAREAERRGAAAVLLYNDPEGDGFVKGEVYPEGPMRPETGLQRGSILNSDGDPSTPTGPSLPGAARVPESRMAGVSRIPVVPIGYGAAAELFRPLEGPEAPEGWQGGLALTYHVGPGPTTARVHVLMEQGEPAYRAAFNTIAAVRGTEWPDEWVIAGGHRDSWGPGATDNVSGTSSVLAAARAFAELAEQGFRPRRTVVFATWDAEEWGIIGSIEWVEAHEERLRGSVVAYVNQDGAVSGTRFGSSAAPELAGLVREVAADVTDPASGRPLIDVWLERVNEPLAADEQLTEPTVGTMGGGSDHKGFYLRLGIPAAGFGFGGEGGVYHSMYDTPAWMERFGDPGYRYHAAAARMTAMTMARLANADVLPYDHAALAAWVRRELGTLSDAVNESLRAAGAEADPTAGVMDASEPTADSGAGIRAALAEAIVAADEMEAEARAFLWAREARLAQGQIDQGSTQRVNESLRRVGQELAPAASGAGQWSRNMTVISDPDNGYSALTLPAARLALRNGDLPGVERALEDLTDGLRGATDRIRDAAIALGEPASAGR